MKNRLFLLLLCVLISACAKKTSLIDSKIFSHQIKTLTDTSAHKSSSTTNKTISFSNRSIDTSIIVAGKELSGYLTQSKLQGKDTSAYFANDDLSLLLYIDKTGRATATATPKLKTIKVKAFEHTAVYNDITRTEETAVKVKSELAAKTNQSTEHTEKTTTGAMLRFSWILIVLLPCLFLWIVAKFTFLGKLLR